MIPHETIRYAFADTSLGATLVAASDAGVVAIHLGDDRARLIRELEAGFPNAALVADQPGLVREVAAAAALVAAPGAHDLPLDLRGSAQQVAMWRALQAVSAGEITTYGAIAKVLPVPATAHEVDVACAANRIALAIPCHRVVKADGSISGYRWGVNRKRRLINLEAVA